MKLLLVEDERDLNASLTKLLKKQQYSVDAAFDGQEALDFLAVASYDLIILDIMMPHMDGFEFLERIRLQENPVPVLLLTARDAVTDKIRGLDLGADDYMVKPFEFDELLARLRVLLRRPQRHILSDQVEIGPIRLILSQKRVLKDGQAVNLTAKEYEVLEYLVRNQNQVLSREQIRHHVWDYEQEAESNTIDVLIKNIRRKLDSEGQPSLIQTRRGLGYVVPRIQAISN